MPECDHDWLCIDIGGSVFLGCSKCHELCFNPYASKPNGPCLGVVTYEGTKW